MKILYITRKFLPSIGGMQTQSTEFYENLSQKNDVILIAWRYSQFFLPFFIIFAFLKSIIVLLENDIEIIQIGDLLLSPLGLSLKIFFKKPTLAVSHGRDSACKIKIYDFFIIRASKKLDKIICVSTAIKEKLLSRGFVDERLTVIPNGISVNDKKEVNKEFSVGLIKERFGLDLSDKKVIFSIGRLVPKKGIKEFIEKIFYSISKKNGEVVFLIGGDGPERDKILYTINKLNLAGKVFMLGYIKHNCNLYKALFNISDVFVMPNIRVKDDFEGFGLIVLEAGLNGVPIVAYDVDGIKEGLHDKNNGILIKEADTQSFSEAICAFLNDVNLKKDFAKRAKEYVINNFNWAKMIDIYLDEYRKLIAKE